ncbi:ATP-binding protein [Candidatus Omnitrophota bacterium]
MFRPLRDFLARVTDRYLFQKRYDYKELLRTFTQNVLSVLDLKALGDQTVQKLTEVMRLSNASIILFDEEDKKLSLLCSKGIDVTDALVASRHILVHYFGDSGKVVFRPDENTGKNFLGELRLLFDKLDAEMLVPLILRGNLIGILSLGKKMSDEPYSQDDIAIIQPLARTLSVAISNARLFEQLSKTQAEAAQKDKMATIGTLAAGIAHEIRNPITTIKTFSEFLRQKKDDPEFLDKYERLVSREVDRINYTINHLLEFAQPGDTITIEPVDINEELKNVQDLLKNEFKLEDINFVSFVDESTSKISGNKKLVQEVLFNLIQNAIHSVDRGGFIKVIPEKEGSNLILTIEDSGCGITEDALRHIFDPFYTTKSNIKGSGLGLYIVRLIMEKMNGSISVDSKVGKGTVVRLEFSAAFQKQRMDLKWARRRGTG